MIQERNAKNAVTRQYAWGLHLGGGIGGLLNQRRSGKDYAYLYDASGNVEAVLNASQQVVAAYRYDPYGTLLAKTGTFDQPFQFSTKRYDARIGMVQYEFRNYLPAIGRWMTRDPLGEAGGLNLYAFVGNNPVNWVDPWGLRQKINLGNGWTGEMDVFNTSGRSLHEIHVYNNAGAEVGVFGPTGWINKHGFIGGPSDIPSNVYNRLNGINIKQLRREGLLPPRGRMNLKGGRYMAAVGKILKALGPAMMLLEAIDLAKRAEESGKSFIQIYYEDMGICPVSNPNEPYDPVYNLGGII